MPQSPQSQYFLPGVIGLFAGAILGLAIGWWAAGPGMVGHEMAETVSREGPQTPAAQAYLAANRKMHDAMNIELSDNPDRDFMKMMIAHHQGAVEMARIVLEHGKDPEVRKLAEAVVQAQEAEILFMQEWLQRNP